MSRPQTRNHTAIARGDPLFIDYNRDQIAAGIAVIVNGGTAPVWQVQHTFDEPNGGAFTSTADFKANATWFDTAGGAGTTANADTNIIVGVTAVSLNVTAGTGLDIDLVLIQPGIGAASNYC